LAATCALVRIKATVVPLEDRGSAVVPHDGARAPAAAGRLSRVLGQADVLLLTRREGQVEAQRWRAGALADAPAPGLVLAGLPDAAERLLLGATPGSLPGAISTRGLSRLAAARTAVSGSPAEAAWTARAQRWDRVTSLVLLALLAALVVLQVVLTASGQGSPVILGVALAALALFGMRALRRRRVP
jgi:hypothetical protein